LKAASSPKVSLRIRRKSLQAVVLASGAIAPNNKTKSNQADFSGVALTGTSKDKPLHPIETNV
jgi:hypothetical protein